MSIWVLAYHLYHYAQREINVARENARLSVIAKEAQLSNLSAQLNPHFFFNSLNNIKSLVIENPQSARRAIDLLSDLLRNSLYSKDDKLIPVKEEISLVKDYLELEKMRFEERLQLDIMVEEKLLGILIPPLSIQTLVENAVKHGIDKRKEGGLIEVKVEEEGSFLKISVVNPGKLPATELHTGLGLKNLKERLLLQFNGKASFNIAGVTGEKVLATILIPIHA
jgi:LytS/YehU family sensor histidine kinase